MRLDFLLVGQGLAGSLLAWEMIRQGYRVMLIDNGEENASQAAAGLINPVSGQRLAKSFLADELLPAAWRCYRQLAVEFGQTFWVEMDMWRILQNPREREQAARRLAQDEYRDYLDGLGSFSVPGRTEAAAVLRQRRTGYLRTAPLLARLRAFFIAAGAYLECRLDYRELGFRPELRWRDLLPRHIVFCEGYRAAANPWFGHLPFQLVKGEILACESAAAIPGRILNFGHWLIPLDESRFKIGATFERQYADVLPGRQAKTQLLAALRAVCPELEPVRVLEHKAGVRPATLDKQPFVGAHPDFANLHIFNGFGSKGSLSIPWHASRFIDAVEGRRPLPPHCDIRRYDALQSA